MMDHNRLKYPFDHPYLNNIHPIWLALPSEYDFQKNHIKGKENRVVGVLSRSIQVIHLETINTYVSYLKINVKEVVLVDENYIQIRD
jgi:hypothetical protein